MKAEHINSANQGLQALRYQCLAVISFQRRLNRAQVCQEIFSARIRVLRCHCMACGVGAGQGFKRGSQPGIHAGQSAAVGLVLAVRVGVW